MDTFVTEPRPPLSGVYDADLVRHIRREVFRASFPRRTVVLRCAVMGGLALAVGLVWQSRTAAVVVLVALLVLPNAVGVVRVARRAHTLSPGMTVVSGYDREGQLVVVRPAGRLAFPAGHARRLIDHGDVVVIVPRRPRAAAFVIASALLTAADREHLTRPLAQSDPRLPHAVTITPQIHRALAHERLFVLARPRGLVLLMGIAALETALIASQPPAQRRVLLFTVLISVALVAVLMWYSLRLVFPSGAQVRAGLGPEVLHLGISTYPPVIPFAEITEVRLTPRAIVLRRGPVKHFLLPRDLLPPADLAVLRAAAESSR